MDTDLTPVDEGIDTDIEETPLFVDNGRPVTIVARNLSKHFTHKGGVIKAVDEVSFTFTEQQFITIMGPSGSGRDT